jgi:hypothetical protein
MITQGVKIGDVFSEGKHRISEVVDILEKRSTRTGEVVGYECIAKSVRCIAHNEYPVPFIRVAKNRIENYQATEN